RELVRRLLREHGRADAGAPGEAGRLLRRLLGDDHRAGRRALGCCEMPERERRGRAVRVDEDEQRRAAGEHRLEADAAAPDLDELEADRGRQWTISTSQCARRATPALTLPPSRRSRTFGSRVPTTIRSAPRCSASSTIVSAGSPTAAW